MEPWYKNTLPRAEVREGRSFNPDEFAIALEQVAANRGPDDYRDPVKFFSRTCFTRALREHMGMVLRRLAGQTENTAPVMTLVTQFGGGKTHTLTALYHLANSGNKVKNDAGVVQLLSDAGLKEIPTAKVAVFVGNAWDSREDHETPWIDIARQLAGDKGVEALGSSARDIPPGTSSIAKLVEVAGGSVLILCDEVLNYINRYRGEDADKFHAFIQNLTVAMTGTERSAAIISLPRSQVEMSDYDMQWQEKINKVVRRVAKDLIANDEAEISEVVRKRLFEDLGSEKIRKGVAKAYADWCFDRRSQLPPEWTAVDTAATEAKARELLRSRFEACYPFHPATSLRFPPKMGVFAAVSTDSRSFGSICSVDIFRLQRFARKGSKRAPDNYWFRTAGVSEFPRCCSWAVGRSPSSQRNRSGYRGSDQPRDGSRCGHIGGTAGHSPARCHNDTFRIFGRTDGQECAPA